MIYNNVFLDTCSIPLCLLCHLEYHIKYLRSISHTLQNGISHTVGLVHRTKKALFAERIKVIKTDDKNYMVLFQTGGHGDNYSYLYSSVDQKSIDTYHKKNTSEISYINLKPHWYSYDEK